MINLSDLQNMMGGMPNSQKIKKKKPKEGEKPGDRYSCDPGST